MSWAIVSANLQELDSDPTLYVPDDRSLSCFAGPLHELLPYILILIVDIFTFIISLLGSAFNS